MVDIARLKAQIVLRGKTAGEVTKAIGMSHGSWHNRLNGKVSFTLEEIVKLAEYLGMSKDDVMQIFFA